MSERAEQAPETGGGEKARQAGPGHDQRRPASGQAPSEACRAAGRPAEGEQEEAAGEAGARGGRRRGRPSKLDVAIRLGKQRYQLGRTSQASSGRPYAKRDNVRYLFDGKAKAELRADLRYAWQCADPDEATPSDSTLNSAISALKRFALEVEPDPTTAEDRMRAAGVSPDGGPSDRGAEALRNLGLDGSPVPENYAIPEPYEVDAGGVWRSVEGGEDQGASRVRVAWSALLPVGVLRAPDGAEEVELAWWRPPRWVRRAVPRSVAKSGRRLVAALGDQGLPVIEADAKQVERWLAAAEAANWGVLQPTRITRHLGWQPDGTTFVTGDQQPWPVRLTYDTQARALAAYHPHGTLEGWQEAVAPLTGHPRAQIGIYASLAAPLLKILGLPSFTVDWSGRSTTGKTITVVVGLSAWAAPSETAGAFGTWKTSVIATEKRLNLVRGLPVVLDESQLAFPPELVADVLYQVGENVGKGREGGWASMLAWETIVLSTGERPALSFTARQGASARVLSVEGYPFGSDPAAAIAAHKGVLGDYGTAGPAFVARLMAVLGEDGGHAKLLKLHRGLVKLYATGGDLSRRRAPLVACLHLAAILAHQWGVVAFQTPEPGVWLELFAGPDPRDDRPGEAFRVIREFIAARPDRVWGLAKVYDREGNDRPREYAEPPPLGWAGRLRDDGAVALLPEVVRQELKRAGYELDEVKSEWARSGAIRRDGRNLCRLERFGGGRERMYVFEPATERSQADAEREQEAGG
jgi:Domain of unknown function (DUF927)